jgi:hypothetical protein
MGVGAGDHGPGGGRREMVRCGSDFWVVSWKTGLPEQEIVSPELSMVKVQTGWADLLLLENSLSMISLIIVLELFAELNFQLGRLKMLQPVYIHYHGDFHYNALDHARGYDLMVYHFRQRCILR